MDADLTRDALHNRIKDVWDRLLADNPVSASYRLDWDCEYDVASKEFVLTVDAMPESLYLPGHQISKVVEHVKLCGAMGRSIESLDDVNVKLPECFAWARQFAQEMDAKHADLLALNKGNGR